MREAGALATLKFDTPFVRREMKKKEGEEGRHQSSSFSL